MKRTTYIFLVIAYSVIVGIYGCKKDGTNDSSPGYILTRKPSVPSQLTPKNGSIGVSVDATLNWNYNFGNIQSDSHQAYPILYTIWFDTVLNPITVVETGKIFTDGPNSHLDGIGNLDVDMSSNTLHLKLLTTYYWKIGVKDARGTSQTSSIWNFTTRGEIVLPQVTTINVSTFTGTTANVGGFVVFDGWSPVTDRGVYFGENSDPEISGAKMQIGSGSGEYESTLTNLKPNTTYLIKAYATNIKGTSFGDQVSFITKPGYDLPSITTRINGWTTSSASVAGNITYDGGAEIIARGICWSTTQNPNISGNSTNEGTGNGEFISNLTGLSSLTTYYIRAYATNSAGTSYSDQLSFTTQGTLTDIEGNQYSTQPIGDQIWMAENLKTTKLSDGTSIPNITDPVLWGNLTSPTYCWYNNDEVINKITYGALYNWYTVNTGKLCPAGWHVPKDTEWETLIKYLGGADIAGGKLKNKTGWRSADNYSNNESGFSGLPGGFVSYSGFQSLDIQTSWWSSTILESSLQNAFKFANSITILDGHTNAWSVSEQQSFGLSVRCLKD